LLQQKFAKRDGAQIDRNRDIEHLWEFYLRYKRRHRVDDIQREEQRFLDSGTLSANLGEYGQLILIYLFSYDLFVYIDLMMFMCIIYYCNWELDPIVACSSREFNFGTNEQEQI
jgi:hypothetical protein